MGEWFFEAVIRILFVCFLLPLMMAVGTPFILVASAYGRDPYWVKVRKGYAAVYELWQSFVAQIVV